MQLGARGASQVRHLTAALHVMAARETQSAVEEQGAARTLSVQHAANTAVAPFGTVAPSTARQVVKGSHLEALPW